MGYKIKIFFKAISILLIIIFLLIFCLPGIAMASWKNLERTDVFDNVSDNTSNSTHAKFQLDNSSNPYVVWFDHEPGNNDIYFKKWTSLANAWTKMDGTAGVDNISDNSFDSINPGIKLNNSGSPYIVWLDQEPGNWDVYFKKWNPVTITWTKMDGTAGFDNISNMAGTSNFAHVEIDSNSNPYIVWSEQIPNTQIYFTKWTPGVGWTKMDGTLGKENISNHANNADTPLIKLDSANNPYVAWQDDSTGSGDIYFKKWTPAANAWTKMDGTLGTDNISTTVGGSNNQILMLNSANNPYVIWDDGTTGNGDIYFTRWTPIANAWTKMDGTAGYDNVSNTASISNDAEMQIDHSDIPYAVWHDNTSGSGDIYFKKWTASANAWTKMDGTAGYDNLSNTGTSSVYPELQISSAGNPYILWEEWVGIWNYEIYFRKWTPGLNAWTKMGDAAGTDNISNTSSFSEYGLILLSNTNFPGIIWQEDISGQNDILFTHWIIDQTSEINISASVEPTLTLNLSATTCDLGTFDAAKVNTCQYDTTVTTNASSGYTAFVRDDGNLRNLTNDINDVAGGTTDPGTEAYGVATSDTDPVDITAVVSGADCTTANGGTDPVDALALTTSDQSYATEGAPVDSDVVTLCHSASIAGLTPAGAYAQTVTITVVGNY
jgi:hypothetical protein